MSKPKVILAFSGGLDTSFCVKYLTEERGMEVHSALVDTGGFSPEELKAIEKQDPELYHQFDTELRVLNQNYQNLKQELPKNPNQEELLKAMIQNVSMQIELLNQQLEIIQKIKEAKNEKTNTMV